MIAIIITAVLTVFIKVNANPAIDYEIGIRRIKLEDYNISYDVISASFISFIVVILSGSNSAIFKEKIGGTIVSTDVVFLLAFSVYFYIFVYLMRRVGWSDVEEEELSKTGVLISSFYSITAIYFIYFILRQIIRQH